jgi:hypothetical protein
MKNEDIKLVAFGMFAGLIIWIIFALAIAGFN